MTSLLNRLSLCVCLLQICVTAIQEEPTEASSNHNIQSVEDTQTILPCHYQPSGNNVIVQVTWMKVKPDGTKEQMIAVHHINGQTGSGAWMNRVYFKSIKPIEDSTLVIMNTRFSDQGDYICRITTFPGGNVDLETSLSVWIVPISSIDSVVVVEGEAFREVASCRSVGFPPPQLSWDTDLNGQASNWTSNNGAVSTYFSLHPLRRMNGMKLDCLVWHPLFPTPRRMKNQLVVQFPPHADVTGYYQNWYVGKEDASLTCTNGGNPKPTITWTRIGGKLPAGAEVTADSLKFTRPLNLSDEGTYQCVAKNSVGEMKAEVEISLEGGCQHVVRCPPEDCDVPDNRGMIYLGAGAAVLFILMLILTLKITCKQRSTIKRLRASLDEKLEIESVGYSPRMETLTESSKLFIGDLEENPTTKSSSSLEPTFTKSTNSLGWKKGGEYDSLGRPSLHNNSRRGRETLRSNKEVALRADRLQRNGVLEKNVFHPPLTPSVILPLANTNEVCEQMSSNTKMPPISVRHTYLSATDDDDEVDEGLGGPASQEHPDEEEDSESSSTFSTSTSRKCPSKINPHLDVIHKAQIV
ncbi:transcript variant X2 [Nothobranchius furzeri]|uniref:Transcript variant X2 n=2 Tax=Nothobranchius TaxID=28779 RepID=A0A9D3BI63_NOTFU|nr:transcript variant X2 [Nothobranchius furzeri]